MSILFDIIYLLLAVFYLPSLLFKDKRRKGLRQRFGIYPYSVIAALKKRGKNIWVHAVSVGEMKAAAPLMERLRVLLPDCRFVISTVTSTGNDIAGQIAAENDIVIYLPFDLSFLVKRALSLVNPKLLLIMETELWPNMIRIAAKRKIPVVIANGRISDKAYPGYKKLSFVFAPVIKKINLLCMQSEQDAQRIIDLGAQRQRVKVVGNIKFDQNLNVSEIKLPELKDNKNDILIIAGSTHDNEEDILARVFTGLKQKHHNLRLLLAPRHPQRALDIGLVLAKYGLSYKFISQVMEKGLRIMPEDVLVLDIMGVLGQVYQAADIVFMGGSLVRHGGQNPIEPALCLKPIVFGKHMFNFREIEKLFLQEKAAISVDNEESLGQCLDELIRDKAGRDTLAANARALVMKNQGAAQRIGEILEDKNLLGE